jgi:hypothetical protein
MNAARTAAARESEHASRAMRERMAVLAQEMVVMPAERELSEFTRFREELGVAAGGTG